MATELLALGLSHRTAPLDLRERAALPEGRAAGLMGRLTGEGADAVAEEAAVLSTCNRTEVYLVTGDAAAAAATVTAALEERAGDSAAELGEHIHSRRGPEAARHLLDVTAGLDSMIVGEAEIQGQVRRAHQLALVEGSAGPILNQLFRVALTAGGRVRSETAIAERGVSIASVAVDEARHAVGALDGRRVLVVGAGDTAELVAAALARSGAGTVFVANRHFDRAQLLAERFGGEAARIADLPGQIERADIVISATNSPTHLIDLDLLAPVLASRGGRPLHFLDLAVPRDIDPEIRGLGGVTLSDLDDLQRVVERNAGRREAERERASAIVSAELERFEAWLETLAARPTIAALHSHAESIVTEVLAENESRWEALAEADRERVELLARTVAGRLLHTPTELLRESAGREEGFALAGALHRLFDLDGEA